MFGGRQLEDDVTLASAGVSDESTMYIVMRLLGGAKKRKKKTYTKPKKQKHKHKKIKLAVLKLYKVSAQLLLLAMVTPQFDSTLLLSWYLCWHRAQLFCVTFQT